MLLGTYSPVFQTPLGALTTLFPLSIVLVISMVQEGLADLKRHRADDEVRRPAAVSDRGGRRAVGKWVGSDTGVVCPLALSCHHPLFTRVYTDEQ